MTLNILVSFSLLALVVTARPISDAPQSVRKSLALQNAVQAILASRTGQRQDYLAHAQEDDVHISLTSSEEQSAFLSTLNDLDAIKAVIPLAVGGSPSDDEKELYEILKNLNQNSGHSLQDLDGEPAELAPSSPDAASPVVEESTPEYPSVGVPDLHVSPPLVIIAVSCIAAFLSMLCIGAGLYALTHLRSFLLTSDLSWDVLPRLERRVGLDGPDDLPVDTSGGGAAPLQPEKRRLLAGDALLPIPLIIDEKLNEKASDVGTDSESNADQDEKYEDAPEHSLLFLDPDLPPSYSPKPTLPQIVIDDVHPDPDFLPLPERDQSTPFATPLASPRRSPAPHAPQMRELPTSPSKPLWSLRAADAPALGLSSSGSNSGSPTVTRVSSPSPQPPGALFADDELMVEIPRPQPVTQAQNRPRPRQPLDIAFALQLRPGLGLGADSAWLVRFLMTMFGWMTVLIGGGGARREDTRRALTA